MKKTLWIQILSYRPASDAPANRAYAFARHFAENGWDVKVLTNGEKDSTTQEEDITVYRLKNVRFYKKKSLKNRLLANLCFKRKCKRVLKQNRATIKNSWFLASSPELLPCKVGLLAKKLGGKFVFDVRDIWPEVAVEMGAFSASSLPAKIFRKTALKLYRSCDFLTTVSKGKANYLSSICDGEFMSKTKLIPNGFDLDSLTENPDFSVLSSLPINGRKVISYVGNVGKAQGLTHLIDLAIAVDPGEFCFVIAGKGADLSALEQLVREKRLANVFFTGFVSKQQSIAITCSSYISYIPLLSEKMTNSIPTKLYESLGFGVPTLLVAEGESTEILQESKLGLSLSPRDIKKLPEIFSSFCNTYDSIAEHKDFSKALITKQYSRQKASEDLRLLLESQGE